MSNYHLRGLPHTGLSAASLTVGALPSSMAPMPEYGAIQTLRRAARGPPAWQSIRWQAASSWPTRGGLCLANTQPFMRELFGRVHVFAHNGTLADIEPVHRPGRFEPLGETGSEVAFCAMLEAVAAGDGQPSSVQRIFVEQVRRLRGLGPANLLYASCNHLLVHSDRRTQASGAITPPGLWLLERSCQPSPTGDARRVGVEVTGAAVRVVIVASVPLTEEAWRPLDRGSVLEIVGGAIIAEHCLDQAS